MRVLTFNSHQPYLHLMALSLPWTIGVISPRVLSGKETSWNERVRPIPENVLLYSSLADALKDSPWDWILTHNVHDLLDCRPVALPKVFLVHGTLTGRILQERSRIDRDEYLKGLRVLLGASRCRVVYISDLKREDWGIPGDVIRPAINSSHYGGYRGDIRGVLQVCNHVAERAAMLGWETYQTVCKDLTNLVLGENRGLAGSRAANDWQDLKEQYRSYRVYLYTAIHPYEDGYNLALLEAMATGMPVATLTHPTSPVEDGIDGVVASSADELRERVLWLLDNPADAHRLGSAARIKVEQWFPLSKFQQGWHTVAAGLS